MHRRHTYLVAIVTGALMLSYGCKRKPEEQKPAGQKPQHTFAANESVREINISLETPDFPEYEGRGEFLSYCSMCHSLKYVTMQPDFSKKVWEAEVKKMVVKYNAPIDSVTCHKIVDYLVMAKKPDPQNP